jgi:Chaperone of endosialidase
MNHMVNLKTLGLLALALVCFGLLPTTQAVNPPPDGGYPGQNTAEGQSAFLHLAGGTYNTALGWASLGFNVTGNFNTAVGAGTLLANTGEENTATGAGALLSNTTGTLNTANGAFALFSNTTAGGNTAIGVQALFNTTTGSFNTANGYFALGNNTTGSFNTALGTEAGGNVVTADNVICIGHFGEDVSNTTWINNVYGVTTQSGTTAPVIVSGDGQLGTVASSERFKKDIATMDKGSEAILSLRPVTFHYKTDTQGTPQFGLIAEEVAKVNPALVLLDKEGKPYTVRYDAVNAMLLNEFLKEHRKVEQLTKEFQTTVAQQQKQIEALTEGLQKVSAQLEAGKPAPHVVANAQ